MARNLGELALEMRNRSASLFLGAGSSVEAGGPNDDRLLKALKSKFPGNSATNTLAYVEELLFDRGEGLRPEIERFVKNCLQGLGPTEEHRYLLSIPWRAVITTNYDNIPDMIGKTLDGNRYITPVIDVPEKDKTVDPRHNDYLYCFKLLGDCNYTYAEKGWMVLSRSDFTKSVRRRKYFFDMFSALASTGSIVYVGYSFEDRFIFQMLSDMKYELQRFPWKGYAISPNQPSGKTLERMKEYNIEWIEGTLSALVGNLRMIFGKEPSSYYVPSSPLLVNNVVITLDKSVELSIRRRFRYLNNNLMEPVSTDPHSFFSGKEISFYPYKAGFDYPRVLKLEYGGNEIKAGNGTCITTLDFVKDRIKHRSSNMNKFMILVGIAGSGKTVVANRIAYDWYQNRDPVIFIDSRDPSYEVQILESLIDEITAQYRQISSEPEPRNPKFLLVADDRPEVFNELVDAFKSCTADGKPVDMLLVSRDSELPPRVRNNPIVNRIYSIEDRISTTEIAKFADHLIRIKFARSKEQVIPYIDDPNIKSFFEMVWRAVTESRIQIATALCNEYDKLSSRSKKVYGLVSLIQAFNLQPLLSMIEKMSKEDLQWLSSELSDGHLSGVLWSDSQGNKVSCSHRIVAGIVAQHAFPTKEDALAALKALAESVSDGNVAEMELVDDLLNKRLEGRIGIAREYRFSNQQRLELYDAALQKIKTGPLLHHKAMVLREMGEFLKAKENIREAKTIHYPGFDEPESYLLDTEGRIELDEAKMSEDPNEKWNHLERAQNIFELARDSPLKTPHVYQGLALTYLEEARISDRESKNAFILLALQQSNHFRSYVGGYEHKGISVSDIERNAMYELDDIGFSEADAEVVAEKFGNTSGFAYLAEQLTMKKTDEEEAFRLIEKGLEYRSKSTWLLRLKLEWLKAHDTRNRRSIRHVLDEYNRIRENQFDMTLDFQLAKQKFMDHDYNGSFGIFRQLSNMSHMNPARYEMLEENRWLSDRGPVECFGEIVQVPAGRNGLIKMTNPIGCNKSIEVRQRHFPPRARPGDKVSFQVIFNYAGPQASRVVKLG